MEDEKKDIFGENLGGEEVVIVEEAVISMDGAGFEDGTNSDGNGAEEAFGKGKKTKPLNKKFIGALILIVLLIVGYSAYKGGKLDQFLGKKPAAVGMTNKEAEDFINANLVQEGAKVAVTAVTEESGLYKITGTVQGQEFTIYLSKDKNIFFPQAMTMADIQKQKADAAAQQQADQTKQQQEMVKSDKPTVQLFVMSHCPYGTQIEKGIIPVLETLGTKIDFKLEFCDYSMHGDKELKEEMNQYCIMQTQSSKFISYLKCFLGDENSSSTCMGKVGIDANKVNACVASTDTKYKITANAADKSTYKSGSYPAFPIFQSDVNKFQVQGSPTLVINGKEATSNRDSASLLKTICSAFNNPPAECGKTLDSTAPSTGFGYAAGSGNSSASCGS